MKNLLTASFIASTVLFSAACTPRDVKVSGGIKTLNKDNRNGNNKTTSKSDPGTFSFDNYSLSTFVGEKHIETLELVKLFTGSMDAKQSRYDVKTGTPNEAGALPQRLESVDEEIQYASLGDTWSIEMERIFEGQYTKDHVVTSASMALSKSFSKTSSETRTRFFVGLKDAEMKISVTPDADPQLLKIEMTQTGVMSGAKGEDKSNYDVSLRLSMTVNAASLETDTVQIVSINSTIIYPNPRPTKDRPTFDLPVTGQNLVATIKSGCSSMQGSLGVKAGRNSFSTVFANDKISIGGKDWSRDLAECGKRPAVDLARLL